MFSSIFSLIKHVKIFLVFLSKKSFEKTNQKFVLFLMLVFTLFFLTDITYFFRATNRVDFQVLFKHEKIDCF